MSWSMLLRSIGIWLIMASAAVANGIARVTMLIPWLGEDAARPVSALILLSIVFALSLLHHRWSGGLSTAQAWTVGVLWLALTLLFETVLGLSQGMSAEVILASYDPFSPSLWVYVVAAILLAPPVVHSLQWCIPRQ